MTLTSKTSCYRSKFITAELASVFSQSEEEEEDFEGFTGGDEEVESEDSDMDTGFYSDEEVAPPRRSLCVALKKEVVVVVAAAAAAVTPPPRRGARERKKKQQQQEEVKKEEDKKVASDEEEEEKEAAEEEGEGEAVCLSLRKRDKNIMENKAMLAQLFADLSTMAELSSLNTPQKRKSSAGEKTTPRKRGPELQAGSERRNPSRKARPPEHFAVEEKQPGSPGEGRVPHAVDVDEDGVQIAKKRRVGSGSRRSYVVRSVDDITEEELDNIADRAKDKIWDKDHGSSCHQCRQKTLDTKTVCRSGFCVGGKGQFCGPCLKNRYGEDVREVLLDPMWSCPLCRGVCNCSLCRKREGRCATGILVRLARYNGHDNVHHYLQSIQKELA
ncbi:hypothetical protein CRUP_023518 [Coryphaenoides rupestris]|nr:hypothetical protein CRUP_023518 [Coryphaenoides rupestris]